MVQKSVLMEGVGRLFFAMSSHDDTGRVLEVANEPTCEAVGRLCIS